MLIEQSIVSYLLKYLSHGIEPQSPSRPSSPTITNVANQTQHIPVQAESIPTQTTLSTIPISFSKQQLADPDSTLTSSHLQDEGDGSQRVYSTSTPISSELQIDDDREHLPRSRHQLPKVLAKVAPEPLPGTNDATERRTLPSQKHEASRGIFKPLEDYIVASLLSWECVNTSFSTVRPSNPPRAASEGTSRTFEGNPGNIPYSNDVTLSAMDAKTLLIGDFAENGSWWTGGRSPTKAPKQSRSYRKNSSSKGFDSSSEIVDLKSPNIDWTELSDWYRMVLFPGNDWRRHLSELLGEGTDQRLTARDLHEMEDEICEAQAHSQRVLLKATENLLKRPGAPLKDPEDIRFLLVILANPLLYPSHSLFTRNRSDSSSRPEERRLSMLDLHTQLKTKSSPVPPQTHGNVPGHHSGIIKRVLGLLSNLPNGCHHHLVSWFMRFSEGHFRKTTELIGSFVTYRLTRQHGQSRATKHDPIAGLVPSIASSSQGTSAALHAVLGVSSQSAKQSEKRQKTVVYDDDWQIKAAARVMALLFSANNSDSARKLASRPRAEADIVHSVNPAARDRAHRHGQILATSDFYNTLLDYSDLIADFEAWEAKRGKFAFCQYPFFLSIWAKIQIMEYDARRQMEIKAREAFFDSIMTRKTINQYLVLKIRRECLVEDSLKGVGEVVGTGGEDIKKGLRIEFKGEEGIDAGGLRKEWFLLLVRDVFNPEHGWSSFTHLTAVFNSVLGMFTYDDDSNCCYFNPNSFETSDQFFLVGVVLGLAIYNSTILDVALPSFAFKKLLAAGPTASPGAPSHAKPTMVYSLEDLAEYRPALAQGLRQLLEFEGNVEETFCRDFVADVERYGQITQIPLCPNGKNRPVNNFNRREFVDLYVRYLLDTAVTRQFEPFKRGFFRVCGGNALSLFRPEEIELLIRGSDEPLDVKSLRAVSTCENWGVPDPAETEPVIGWFWSSFENAQPKEQRKLLSFITGSDRIPAMGAANLVIKLSCLGEDSSRFPVARTCFNMLSLWRYGSRERLEYMLWRAVNESEGFGLK